MADRLLTFGFHIICIIVALTMVGWCSYRYYLDEDVSVINYRQFNKEDNDLYPTLTLCVSGIGVMSRQQLGGKQKQLEYQNFSAGILWSNEMAAKEFDNNTIQLENYLNVVWLTYMSDGREQLWAKVRGQQKSQTETFPFLVTYRSYKAKCYSMDIDSNSIPQMKEERLYMIQLLIGDYDTSFGENNSLDLSVYLHYPKQLIRTNTLVEEKRLGEDTYLRNGITTTTIDIMVQNIEVVRYRNKRLEPCDTEWKEDDDKILNQLIQDVGCRPPHWYVNMEVTACQSKDDMKKLVLPKIQFANDSFLESFTQPCSEIRSISHSINSYIVDGSVTTTNLKVYFKNSRYMEVENVRALGLETLFGLIGGYIGLILGFAIWQTPEFVNSIWKTIKRMTK